MPTVLSAILFATLASSSAAHAQEGEAAAAPPARDPFLEIGVFGGGHFFNKKSGLGRSADDDEGLSPDSSGAFGLRLTLNLNKWVGFEAEGLLIPTRLRDDSTNVNVFGYRGQVILNLVHQGYLRPFLLAGFGGYSSYPGTLDPAKRDTDDMIHLGLGVKFPITKNFGLRLDGRFLAPPAFASDIAKIGEETGYDGPDWEALASAYIALGGREAAPPPPPPPPPPP
ncbi:MAG TPA: outer membrane beta-barrel protein, partial [Polyangia bacterium]|nr:outer membrane beta-barrel protein [Polyangia bacterium]